MFTKYGVFFWIGVLAIAGVFSFPRVLAAGCKSDCEETYESAVEDCHLTYDTADDADELQICIQDAKDEHTNCVDECDS